MRNCDVDVKSRWNALVSLPKFQTWQQASRESVWFWYWSSLVLEQRDVIHKGAACQNGLKQTSPTRFGLKQIKFRSLPHSHFASLAHTGSVLRFLSHFPSPLSVELSVSREAFLLLAALYLALPFPMSLSLCVSLFFNMSLSLGHVSPFSSSTSKSFHWMSKSDCFA